MKVLVDAVEFEVLEVERRRQGDERDEREQRPRGPHGAEHGACQGVRCAQVGGSVERLYGRLLAGVSQKVSY